MNTTQIKPVFNAVMGWAAFVLAILATLKLFSVGIPIQIRGSASELALVGMALALCKMP
jgi:hypothetical protein